MITFGRLYIRLKVVEKYPNGCLENTNTGCRLKIDTRMYRENGKYYENIKRYGIQQERI